MSIDNLLTDAEIEAAAEAEADIQAETPEAQESPQGPVEAPQAEAPTQVAAQPVAPAPEPSEPVSTVPVDSLSQAASALDFIAQKLEALEAQYEAGELSFRDFRAAERTLLRHQREAEAVITQARIEAQVAQATVQRDWNSAVAEFRQDPANAAFETPITLPMMQVALNELRAKHPGLSSKDQLQHAKAYVQNQMRALLGLPTDAPIAPVAPARSAIKPPPTLSVVPVAAPNESGEFAALDRLKGLEYERALSKLTPDQQSRYLAA